MTGRVRLCVPDLCVAQDLLHAGDQQWFLAHDGPLLGRNHEVEIQQPQLPLWLLIFDGEYQQQPQLPPVFMVLGDMHPWARAPPWAPCWLELGTSKGPGRLVFKARATTETIPSPKIHNS